MNKTVEYLAGAGALIAAMAVSAQAEPVALAATPRQVATTQTLQAPYAPSNRDDSAASAHPLFHIGQMPVVVWAPVQKPYSAAMNGNLSANSLWDAGSF
jgi:hypothetical protein